MERAAEGDGGSDRDIEVVGGDIGGGAFVAHEAGLRGAGGGQGLQGGGRRGRVVPNLGVTNHA